MKYEYAEKVMIAAMAALVLCSCGPIEDQTGAVDMESSADTKVISDAAENDISKSAESTAESSSDTDSSQAEPIHDPELDICNENIPYSIKCTVSGNVGRNAMLSDYYGMNAMINSDEALLSTPVKYHDDEFQGGVIRFEFGDDVSDKQKQSAVIMYFNEEDEFSKLESFVNDNEVSANITTDGVYMVIDSYVYDRMNGGSVSEERRYSVENSITLKLDDIGAEIDMPAVGDFSAAKFDPRKAVTDDYDGTRNVELTYCDLLDGEVYHDYDGLEFAMSYFQRPNDMTVDDILDSYARSAQMDPMSGDEIWLDYEELDLGNSRRGNIVAVLGEDQSVTLQAIYQISDSEYVQYGVLIPARYADLAETILASQRSFRFVK